MQLPKNINGTNGILYLIIIFPFIIKRARKTNIPINEEIKFGIGTYITCDTNVKHMN